MYKNGLTECVIQMKLQTFQQAWWDPEKNAREKWHEAFRLEFNKMIKMVYGEKVTNWKEMQTRDQ